MWNSVVVFNSNILYRCFLFFLKKKMLTALHVNLHLSWYMEEKVHCRNVEFHSLVSNRLIWYLGEKKSCQTWIKTNLFCFFFTTCGKCQFIFAASLMKIKPTKKTTRGNKCVLCLCSFKTGIKKNTQINNHNNVSDPWLICKRKFLYMFLQPLKSELHMYTCVNLSLRCE